MKPDPTGQLKFLDQIGQILPANVSLVNELADILEISIDSSYRRLRGETSLTFEEIVTLCDRFNLSFDSITATQRNIVSFQYHHLGETQGEFVQYLESLRDDLRAMKLSSSENKLLSYTAQGIPIFHYFGYPWLGALKLHYWMRAILNVRELQMDHFHPDHVDERLIEMSREFYEDYQQVDSTELWSDTTISGMMEQLMFYWNSGAFKNEEDALRVLDEFREMISDIENQAKLGHKMVRENEKESEGGKYNLYYSEIEFENNCILIQSGDVHTVYLSHLSFRSIKTHSDRYCAETSHWFENLKQKAHLISGISETTRYQFFKRCYKKLDNLEARIKQT